MGDECSPDGGPAKVSLKAAKELRLSTALDLHRGLRLVCEYLQNHDL